MYYKTSGIPRSCRIVSNQCPDILCQASSIPISPISVIVIADKLSTKLNHNSVFQGVNYLGSTAKRPNAPVLIVRI